MRPLEWYSKLLIGAVFLVGVPVLAQAATIEFKSDLPESSALLEGDEIVIDVLAKNPAHENLASFQLFLDYDETVFSFKEATINEDLFGVPIPVTDEDGVVMFGGGTLGAALDDTEILLGTLTLTTKTSTKGSSELHLQSGEENGLFVLGTGEPVNVLTGAGDSKLTLHIGDYTPPTHVIPEATTTEETEEVTDAPLVVEDETDTPEVIEQEDVLEKPTLHGAAGDTADLTAPQHLEYDTLGSRVELSWDPVMGADGYYVYYSKDEDTFLHRKKVENPTVTFTELEQGEQMFFIVSAFDTTGEGQRSVLVPLTVGEMPEVLEILPVMEVAPQAEEADSLKHVAEMPSSGLPLPLVLILSGLAAGSILVIKNKKYICKF